MKRVFYDEWKNKRVNKIENIFGRDWFCGKSVLELGAAHGDIGLHFLKLGADVLFADVRIEHLRTINQKLFELNHSPKTIVLDQNKRYDLDRKFDLILHLHNQFGIKEIQCSILC